MDLLRELENGQVLGSSNGSQSEQSTDRKIEPMELDTGEDEEDMDSFLREGGPVNGRSSSVSSQQALQGPPRYYLNGLMKVQPIGNMHILFPEYFDTSGWGVLGPQWFGPACVWGLLMVASHFCINKASALGHVSVIICYLFFGACTYLLTDVSLRDPGICLHKEVPESVSPSEMSQWKWCDFCHVYQAPGGAHCPECNVCIAGYDHHCVWMGTCIGKRNYRQFVRFNVSWLYFLGYVFFWLITFGPLLIGE
jgi:hypothetical protein